MFLQGQGELALGSRLKAASEGLYAIANEAYRRAGIDFDAHWFPVLRYLQVRGPATVTAIATAIGQSHPAVSQAAARLKRAGLVVRRSDRADARRSLLDLSVEGATRLGRLGPVWCAIRRAARAASERSSGSLVAALGAFEAECTSGRVAAEIAGNYARLRASRPVIVPFRAELREHFFRINAEWLERDFELEDIDRQVLSQPEQAIIEPGGAIVFAQVDGETVGTCALLRESPGIYELTKMGVESGWRGYGAGRLLIEALIAEFHRRRGRTLFLETNAKLAPAIALYESVGFVRQAQRRPDSHYRRSDVYMIYDPAARPAKVGPSSAAREAPQRAVERGSKRTSERASKRALAPEAKRERVPATKRGNRTEPNRGLERAAERPSERARLSPRRGR